MRRSFGALVSTLGVVSVLVGVGGAVPAQDGSISPLLYVASDDGVSVVDVGRDETTFSAEHALPSSDWSLVVDARRDGNGTMVEGIDPVTGTVVRSQRLHGRLDVRTVSRSGDLIALMPRGDERYASGLGPPEGRRETYVVLTRLDGAPAQRLEVEANTEPEAFSVDGRFLFVVQYSPPMNPDRYRVRQLDLATGQLGDVYTDQKELQDDMRGTPHQQVLAPDGTRLYTLYTKPNGEAFVHVLSLDQQFANCVDLPEGFGTEPDTMAITTTPDGTTVVVVDGAAERIAEVDAALLRLRRSVPLRGVRVSDAPVVATATDASVIVGIGRSIVQLQQPSLTPVQDWSLGSRVTALHASEYGFLYAAERDRVTGLDLSSRQRYLITDVGNGIHSISDALPSTSKGYVQCAC